MLPPPFPHHHLSSTAWSILHLKWNHLPNLLMHPPSPSNPCLTSFRYLHSLRVSDFGWRPPSIVSSFFCVLTYQCISSCLILQLSIKWLVLDLHCGTQRTVGTCSCSMCLSSCILENLLVWITFPHSDTTESHLFRLRINESMSHSCRLYSLMLSMHRR